MGVVPKDVMNEGSTASSPHTLPASDAERPTRRVLLVLGPALQSSYPLGPSGRVTIGRSSDNLVAVDDPEMSRHHVVLHLGATLRLEDLGSSNGTRVGRRKLGAKETVDVEAGEPIEVGSTMLIVQERAVEPAPRRLMSWDYFELRLDEAIRRAVRIDRPFVVLHLRAEPPAAALTLERRLVGLLPQLDAVARDVPGEYGVLIVDADELDADAAARWLIDTLSDARVRVALGRATYPVDGATVDELTTRASSRAAGLTEEPEDTTSLVCADEASKRLFRLIERVAASALHVLVVGETGVGKDAVVAELHRRSGRAALVRVDCAGGTADTLLEGLFGEGGRFVAARKGTLLLDEVCALPLPVQDRLTAALDRTDEGAGEIRVVATSSRDVEAEVAAGNVRRELFFRLEGMVLTVPPLRRRRADIEPLARRFLEEAAAAVGREPPELADDAIELLRGHAWPGNLRELRNVMRRAVLLCEGPVIMRKHLPVDKLTAEFVAERREDARAPLLFDAVRRELEQVERKRIVEALEQAGGNQTEAARLLGISRRTLINRLEAYGLPRPRKR